MADHIEEKLDKHIQKHDEDTHKITLWFVGLIVTCTLTLGGSFFAWYGNYRSLDERVSGIKIELDKKANKETVETQLGNIFMAIGELKEALRPK